MGEIGSGRKRVMQQWPTILESLHHPIGGIGVAGGLRETQDKDPVCLHAFTIGPPRPCKNAGGLTNTLLLVFRPCLHAYLPACPLACLMSNAMAGVKDPCWQCYAGY